MSEDWNIILINASHICHQGKQNVQIQMNAKKKKTKPETIFKLQQQVLSKWEMANIVSTVTLNLLNKCC